MNIPELNCFLKIFLKIILINRSYVQPRKGNDNNIKIIQCETFCWSSEGLLKKSLNNVLIKCSLGKPLNMFA